MSGVFCADGNSSGRSSWKAACSQKDVGESAVGLQEREPSLPLPIAIGLHCISVVSQRARDFKLLQDLHSPRGHMEYV